MMFKACENMRHKTRVDPGHGETGRISPQFEPFDADREATHIFQHSIVGARVSQQ